MVRGIPRKPNEKAVGFSGGFFAFTLLMMDVVIQVNLVYEILRSCDITGEALYGLVEINSGIGRTLHL